MITGGLFYRFFSQLAPVIPLPDLLHAAGPLLQNIAHAHTDQAVAPVSDPDPNYRRSRNLYRAELLRPIGGARNLHLRTGPYGHFGRGHHRYAGRERRLAGHLQSAEQSLRRCTIPLDILVYRRTRFDAVRTLLRDHLPSDDPLTDPAVRFGLAVEKVSSPCAPRNQNGRNFRSTCGPSHWPM